MQNAPITLNNYLRVYNPKITQYVFSNAIFLFRAVAVKFRISFRMKLFTYFQ